MKKSSRKSSCPAGKKCIMQNEGMVDRSARIALGIVILGIGVSYQSWWGLIGLLPLFTGISGQCCLYDLLGINTNK